MRASFSCRPIIQTRSQMSLRPHGASAGEARRACYSSLVFAAFLAAFGAAFAVAFSAFGLAAFFAFGFTSLGAPSLSSDLAAFFAAFLNLLPPPLATRS